MTRPTCTSGRFAGRLVERQRRDGVCRDCERYPDPDAATGYCGYHLRPVHGDTGVCPHGTQRKEPDND